MIQESDVYCIVGNVIDRQPENGGNGAGYQQDLSYTLTAMDRHAVYARQRVDEFKDDDIASTQSARQSKDTTDLVMEPDRQYAQLVRRLTPLECERLQGFLDDWTNIPGASDSARSVSYTHLSSRTIRLLLLLLLIYMLWSENNP